MAITDVSQKINSLNFATTIRWVALLPLKQLFPNLKTENVAFNLTSYELPSLRISSSTVTYEGYEIEIPTYVKSQDKILTFEYIMSSDWHQWKLLYWWMQKIVQEAGTGAGGESMIGMVLPLRIILLSEFKRPTLEVIYENCWLKETGPIRLDYTDSGAAEVKHSFTIAYMSYKVEDPTE